MSALARLIGTWFYLGYFPKGPGTAGSLGALLVAGLLVHFFGFTPWMFAVLAAVCLLPSIWAADRMARDMASKDPQIVVVDEAIGQWISLAAVPKFSWPYVLAAFLLFRLFDIWKPPPVRALERLPGGTGIVMDDVMAGIYGALVLWVVGWFNLG